MATPETTRRSKRGMTHEDVEEELSVKIPRVDELLDEDEKRSRASSISPAVGSFTLRRESRGGQDKPAELFRKDLISAMKLADSEQLQQDTYFTITDAWKQEWESGVQVPVNPNETIHRNVVVRKISGYETLHGTYAFKLPKKFLHAVNDDAYKQGIHEIHETQKLADQMCRYDLDDIDVMWLTKHNEERAAMGMEPVFEWVMEKVIEELENQCYTNMQTTIKTVEGLGIEYDENVVCDVCRNPEGEDNNEIVFCDGCDICVHQACYGIKNIPEGSWLCRTCVLGIQPTCILCPKTGGAMKSTKSGTKWAHVSCALWIPEVSIGCPEKMEPITKISQIPSSRWSLICNLCRERSGACIQCSVKTCKTAFHVTCAFNNNLNMKTILDEDHDDIQLKAHCSKHSGKREKDTTPRKEPGTPKRDLILKRDLATPTKKESEMTEEEKTELRSHRLGKLAEEFYSCVEVSEVAEACKMDEQLVDFIYSYWVLKRKSNFNKPLLMPKKEEADLLLRQREDSLVARMKMFIHLRQDLERVRNLCYMVSKREKIRRSLYQAKEDVFHQQVAMLNKLHGSHAQTREYCSIVGAHREPATVYDKYDAILRVANASDRRDKLEVQYDTCSDMDSEPSNETRPKTKRTAGFRDSKRRLAFQITAKAKKTQQQQDTGKNKQSVTEHRTSSRLDTSVNNLKTNNNVKTSDSMKVSEIIDSGAGGDSSSSYRRRLIVESPQGTTHDSSEHSQDSCSDAVRRRDSRLRLRRSTQGATQDDKATASPAPDCSASQASSVPVRSPKHTPPHTPEKSNEDKPSPTKSSPGDQTQWLRRSTRTREGLPEDVEEFIRLSESSEGDELYKASLETSPSPKAKHKNGSAEKGGGDHSAVNTNLPKGVKPEVHKRSLFKQDKDDEDKPSPKKTRRSIRGSHTETSESFSGFGGNGSSLPHVEVSVDESSGKISLHVRKQGPRPENKDTTDKRPSRKVSIDETDDVVLPVRKHSLDQTIVNGSPTRDKNSRFRTPRRTSSRLQSLGINGLVSPSQLVVKQEIKDKVHSRLGRLRCRSLNHKQLENGIVDSSRRKVDQILASKRRSAPQLEGDVVSQELLGVGHVFTKENTPNNGPLLNKFRPITLEISASEKSKKLRLLSSPKSDRASPHSHRASLTSVSTSGRNTPEKRRSLRLTESVDSDSVKSGFGGSLHNEGSTHGSVGIKTGDNSLTLDSRLRKRSNVDYKSNSSVIDISDSEESSINVLMASDSEYAQSEESMCSDSSRKLRTRRSRSGVIAPDEASRDSATSSVRSSSRLSKSWSKVVGSLQS